MSLALAQSTTLVIPFSQPSRASGRDVKVVTSLALSDMAAHFNFEFLGRVDSEAPTPSHFPTVEEGTKREGKSKVMVISAPELDPIPTTNVNSPSASRGNNEIANDSPISEQTPLEVLTLPAFRGDVPVLDEGEGSRGEAPIAALADITT